MTQTGSDALDVIIIGAGVGGVYAIYKLRQLGLNDPAPIQFLHFVGNAARGWFGLSYRTSEPVNRMILERMPATLDRTRRGHHLWPYGLNWP